MSSQKLNNAAQIISSQRQHPHMAGLGPVEQAVIEKVFAFAPDLDRQTVGAGWMLLGDAIAQLAARGGLQFDQAVNLIQLAGERLYTETGREIRCPESFSSGAACKFVGKSVHESVLNAQMRAHFATYHPDAAWPAEASAAEQGTCVACSKPKDPFVSYGDGFMCAECALLQGVSSVNDLRRHYGMPPLTGEPAADEAVDRRYFTNCSKCTKFVVMNGTTGQNAGHMTVEGILCGACNRDYKRRAAAINAAAEVPPYSPAGLPDEVERVRRGLYGADDEPILPGNPEA